MILDRSFWIHAAIHVGYIFGCCCQVNIPLRQSDSTKYNTFSDIKVGIKLLAVLVLDNVLAQGWLSFAFSESNHLVLLVLVHLSPSPFDQIVNLFLPTKAGDEKVHVLQYKAY